MFKLHLEKERNHRSNCQHLLDHRKSKRVPEKHLLLRYWLHQSLWVSGSQQTANFLKRWKYQTTLPASWEICMQVKKQQTGSILGKEYVKAVYCQPAYLTYTQSTPWETLAWMKHKLESGLQGEILINIDKLRYANDTTFMVESEEKLKSFLMKVKKRMKKLVKMKHW